MFGEVEWVWCLCLVIFYEMICADNYYYYYYYCSDNCLVFSSPDLSLYVVTKTEVPVFVAY